MLIANLHNGVQNLSAQHLEKSDDVLIQELIEKYEVMVGVPKLNREQLQWEQPVDVRFPAYFDTTLDLPDYKSKTTEIEGTLIGVNVPFSGDYRTFSHPPYELEEREKFALLGKAWVVRGGQSDLDRIESVLAVSEVEIAKHNQEMSELIPRLIAERRAR